MKDFFDLIQDFLYQGGPVLLVIFFVVCGIWFLVLERFIYFRFGFRFDLQKSLHQWDNRSEKISWYARKIRQMELSKLSSLLKKNINHIKTLVSICPLLGLLGTVTGMVSVFEIMAEVGTGNARLMASGISMATIPTMAGMVSALMGLYFGNQLEYRSQKMIQKNSEIFVLDK